MWFLSINMFIFSDDFGHSSPSPLEEVELVYEDDLDEPEIPATNEPFAQLVKSTLFSS